MVEKVGVVTYSVLLGFMLMVGLLWAALPVSADRYSSTSYTIDASTMNTFGGQGTSTSYKLVSSGGEAIIGNGTAGSYKMGQGYVAQLEGDNEEPSMELTVQPSGLLAYYPMDENQGTQTFDASASSNHGTLTNGPVWTTGKLGSALTFDGADDYVDLGSSTADLDIDVGEARTFSVWIKAGAGATGRSILFKNGSCLGWQMSILSDGILHMAFNTGNNGCTGFTQHDAVADDKRYDDDAWHHVIGVIDRAAGKMYMYVDGVKKEEVTVNNTDGAAGGDFRIGTNYNASATFSGIIDEVKIYNRTLSAEEAKAEYDAQNAGRKSGLSLGTVIPGASESVQYDAITQTSVSGYSLAMSQTTALTNGAITIPSVAGTIADPATWAEGTTKGLGFTLVSGAGISGIWGSGNDYAGLPGSATTFYTRTGYTPGTKDVLGMRLRLDVEPTQLAGNYSGVMTISGTMTP